MLIHITPKSPKTLTPSAPNQPTDADERTTRHLRMCAELADLAMQLARVAATRTLADWAEDWAEDWADPEETPAAPPADREAAELATPTPVPHSTASDPGNPSSRKPTDPALLFTRLAAVVRDCIALEARLAAGAADTSRALKLRADRRRVPLCEALHLAIDNHPDRVELNREITTRLDEQLAADPTQTIVPADLLAAICAEFGVVIDFASLPDEYLFAPTDTPNPGKDTQDPRATSPP
jgi:hypothetical protein